MSRRTSQGKGLDGSGGPIPRVYFGLSSSAAVSSPDIRSTVQVDSASGSERGSEFATENNPLSATSNTAARSQRAQDDDALLTANAARRATRLNLWTDGPSDGSQYQQRAQSLSQLNPAATPALSQVTPTEVDISSSSSSSTSSVGNKAAVASKAGDAGASPPAGEATAIAAPQPAHRPHGSHLSLSTSPSASLSSSSSGWKTDDDEASLNAGEEAPEMHDEPAVEEDVLAAATEEVQAAQRAPVTEAAALVEPVPTSRHSSSASQPLEIYALDTLPVEGDMSADEDDEASGTSPSKSNSSSSNSSSVSALGGSTAHEVPRPVSSVDAMPAGLTEVATFAQQGAVLETDATPPLASAHGDSMMTTATTAEAHSHEDLAGAAAAFLDALSASSSSYESETEAGKSTADLPHGKREEAEEAEEVEESAGGDDARPAGMPPPGWAMYRSVHNAASHSSFLPSNTSDTLPVPSSPHVYSHLATTMPTPASRDASAMATPLQIDHSASGSTNWQPSTDVAAAAAPASTYDLNDDTEAGENNDDKHVHDVQEIDESEQALALLTEDPSQATDSTPPSPTALLHARPTERFISDVVTDTTRQDVADWMMMGASRSVGFPMPVVIPTGLGCSRSDTRNFMAPPRFSSDARAVGVGADGGDGGSETADGDGDGVFEHGGSGSGVDTTTPTHQKAHAAGVGHSPHNSPDRPPLSSSTRLSASGRWLPPSRPVWPRSPQPPTRPVLTTVPQLDLRPNNGEDIVLNTPSLRREDFDNMELYTVVLYQLYHQLVQQQDDTCLYRLLRQMEPAGAEAGVRLVQLRCCLEGFEGRPRAVRALYGEHLVIPVKPCPVSAQSVLTLQETLLFAHYVVREHAVPLTAMWSPVEPYTLEALSPAPCQTHTTTATTTSHTSTPTPSPDDAHTVSAPRPSRSAVLTADGSAATSGQPHVRARETAAAPTATTTRAVLPPHHPRASRSGPRRSVTKASQLPIPISGPSGGAGAGAGAGCGGLSRSSSQVSNTSSAQPSSSGALTSSPPSDSGKLMAWLQRATPLLPTAFAELSGGEATVPIVAFLHALKEVRLRVDLEPFHGIKMDRTLSGTLSRADFDWVVQAGLQACSSTPAETLFLPRFECIPDAYAAARHSSFRSTSLDSSVTGLDLDAVDQSCDSLSRTNSRLRAAAGVGAGAGAGAGASTSSAAPLRLARTSQPSVSGPQLVGTPRTPLQSYINSLVNSPELSRIVDAEYPAIPANSALASLLRLLRRAAVYRARLDAAHEASLTRPGDVVVMVKPPRAVDLAAQVAIAAAATTQSTTALVPGAHAPRPSSAVVVGRPSAEKSRRSGARRARRVEAAGPTSRPASGTRVRRVPPRAASRRAAAAESPSRRPAPPLPRTRPAAVTTTSGNGSPVGASPSTTRSIFSPASHVSGDSHRASRRTSPGPSTGRPSVVGSRPGSARPPLQTRRPQPPLRTPSQARQAQPARDRSGTPASSTRPRSPTARALLAERPRRDTPTRTGARRSDRRSNAPQPPPPRPQQPTLSEPILSMDWWLSFFQPPLIPSASFDGESPRAHALPAGAAAAAVRASNRTSLPSRASSGPRTPSFGSGAALPDPRDVYTSPAARAREAERVKRRDEMAAQHALRLRERAQEQEQEQGQQQEEEPHEQSHHRHYHYRHTEEAGAAARTDEVTAHAMSHVPDVRRGQDTPRVSSSDAHQPRRPRHRSRGEHAPSRSGASDGNTTTTTTTVANAAALNTTTTTTTDDAGVAAPAPVDAAAITSMDGTILQRLGVMCRSRLQLIDTMAQLSAQRGPHPPQRAVSDALEANLLACHAALYHTETDIQALLRHLSMYRPAAAVEPVDDTPPQALLPPSPPALDRTNASPTLVNDCQLPFHVISGLPSSMYAMLPQAPSVTSLTGTVHTLDSATHTVAVSTNQPNSCGDSSHSRDNSSRNPHSSVSANIPLACLGSYDDAPPHCLRNGFSSVLGSSGDLGQSSSSSIPGNSATRHEGSPKMAAPLPAKPSISSSAGTAVTATASVPSSLRNTSVSTKSFVTTCQGSPLDAPPSIAAGAASASSALPSMASHSKGAPILTGASASDSLTTSRALLTLQQTSTRTTTNTGDRTGSEGSLAPPSFFSYCTQSGAHSQIEAGRSLVTDGGVDPTRLWGSSGVSRRLPNPSNASHGMASTSTHSGHNVPSHSGMGPLQSSGVRSVIGLSSLSKRDWLSNASFNSSSRVGSAMTSSLPISRILMDHMNAGTSTLSASPADANMSIPLGAMPDHSWTMNTPYTPDDLDSVPAL